jgi:hypothetical protein
MNCNDRQFLGLDQATKMALSRRTFIKGSAGGIGLAALGSLMGTPAFAANPGLGFPNFKPKAKRIIYLFQSGAPSQMDLFDPKPQLEADARQGPAGIHPQGPASDDDDVGPEVLPGRALDLQVQAARPVGQLVQRPDPAHRLEVRRVVRGPCDAHGSDQP